MSAKQKQTQFELFPEAVTEKSVETRKSHPQIKNLTLSIDNIIVLSIVFIMTLVVFFSFGVENGKKVVKSESVEMENSSPQMENSGIMLQPSEVEVSLKSENEVEPVVENTEVVAENQEIIEVPIEVEGEIDLMDAYTIQVASFKQKVNAEKEKEILQKKGFEEEEIFVLPKGDYSIVCIGKFAHRNEAKIYSNRLKNRYNDCIVRRL